MIEAPHSAVEPVRPEGAVPDWPPLASSQVSALPQGSTVIAACSSDDGPQLYTVHRESGRIYARSASDVSAGVLDRNKVLTFVTRVWLPRA